MKKIEIYFTDIPYIPFIVNSKLCDIKQLKKSKMDRLMPFFPSLHTALQRIRKIKEE